MKTNRLLLTAALLGAMAARCFAQIPGVPEPGLVIYGPVVNVTNQQPVTVTSVQWQVAGTSEGVTVNATMVSLNGAAYYVARVPFETRVVGTQNFTKTPGTLELKSAPTTYSRAASSDGLPATILSSSLNQGASFTFGIAARGAVERVVLGVNKSSNTGGNTNAPPEIDANLEVNAQGGLAFQWTAIAGTRYSVFRTTDLSQPFVAIAVNLPATPPKNVYSDPAPPAGATNLFYKIEFSP